MTARAIEATVGLAIVGLALIDIFCTILIPGPAKGPFRIAIRVRDLGLPLWRLTSHRRVGGRRRLSNVFAPLLFFLAFSTWSGLLLFGFGLLFHAMAGSFRPRLDGFGGALYVAGSSLLTLGVSEVDALGHARWLILWAALSGFCLITAAFTYVLQVQSSLHQREAGVLTLTGLAGKPPSGIGLLESFAALDVRDDLPSFFKEWRNWSAATLHSHLSFPMLVYFHSVDAESDWLSALHTVLDAATIIMGLTDERSSGAVALMHRSGSRTASHLCAVFDLGPEETATSSSVDVVELLRRLDEAGYQTKASKPPNVGHFLTLRGDYAGRLASLAHHLGAEGTALLPPSSASPMNLQGLP